MPAAAGIGQRISVEHDAGWTRERIESLLAEAAARATFADRFRTLARPFLEAETPYVRPDAIPSPEPGVLSLRFDRFSCSSFMHLLVALGHAETYPEFVRTVRAIRYGSRVEPNYFISNLLQLMCRMSGGSKPVLTNRVPSLSPHLKNQRQDSSWLFAFELRQLGPWLRCGDVLFFSNAEARNEGARLITHTGFVYKFDDAASDVFLAHCSATERGAVTRRRGCVTLARRQETADAAAGSFQDFLTLPEYLETHRRYFSRVAVFRLARFFA